VVPGFEAKAVSHANAAGDMGPGTVGSGQCRFWRFTARIRTGDPLRTPQISQVTDQVSPKTPLLWPYRDQGHPRHSRPHANVRSITLRTTEPPWRAYIAS